MTNVECDVRKGWSVWSSGDVGRGKESLLLVFHCRARDKPEGSGLGEQRGSRRSTSLSVFLTGMTCVTTIFLKSVLQQNPELGNSKRLTCYCVFVHINLLTGKDLKFDKTHCGSHFLI